MTGPSTNQLAEYLETLCAFAPDRRVGGEGNRQANEWLAHVLGGLGYEVERLPFECVDWVGGDAWIEADGERLELRPGPYSPPAELERATLLTASTAEELAALSTARACVLLLHGQLVADQLTPRNYPFYAFDAHKRVLGELDRLEPAAIVAATTANPGAVGAQSPFPYIQDADVDIPSAYVHAREAAALLAHGGRIVRLRIDSQRRAAHSEQLVARLGDCEKRAVVCAHIDTAFATPGALDNAAGVTCLLGIAQLLAEDPPDGLAIEIVPFNGEDNFAAYGEIAYAVADRRPPSDIALAVNIDAAGFRGHPTAVSFYGVNETLETQMTEVLGGYANTEVGPQWPQSDHMVFAMRGVPAVAITTSAFMEIASKYNHTERDVPELVDASLLVEAARFAGEALHAASRAK